MERYLYLAKQAQYKAEQIKALTHETSEDEERYEDIDQYNRWIDHQSEFSIILSIQML